MSKCKSMKKELILAEIYRQNEHWDNKSRFFSDLKNIFLIACYLSYLR